MDLEGSVYMFEKINSVFVFKVYELKYAVLGDNFKELKINLKKYKMC